MDQKKEDQDLKKRLRSYISDSESNKKKISKNEHNIQELWDTIKGPNIGMIRREEGEELQTEGRESLFSEMSEVGFPNLGKDMDIQVKEA